LAKWIQRTKNLLFVKDYKRTTDGSFYWNWRLCFF